MENRWTRQDEERSQMRRQKARGDEGEEREESSEVGRDESSEEE